MLKYAKNTSECQKDSTIKIVLGQYECWKSLSSDFIHDPQTTTKTEMLALP